jgi:Fe-S-cluster-containing hydrogenase component 2
MMNTFTISDLQEKAPTPQCQSCGAFPLQGRSPAEAIYSPDGDVLYWEGRCWICAARIVVWNA